MAEEGEVDCGVVEVLGGGCGNEVCLLHAGGIAIGEDAGLPVRSVQQFDA